MNRASTCTLVLVLSCAWSLPLRAAPSRVPEPAPTTERDDARAELDAGIAAYERGEFAAAASHFERAHQLAPSPVSLYAWAQAARSAGDCATAVELYRRFIDEGATGDSRTAAEQNEARCREQLAREPPPVPEPVPEPVPVPVPTVPVVAPAPTVPERTDRVAIALLTTGAVSAAAAVALLGIAGAAHREQSQTGAYDRFDALDRRIDALYIAGGALLGVGTVLLAVGGARMAKARRRARAISLAPAWSSGGGAMLMLRVGPQRPH